MFHWEYNFMLLKGRINDTHNENYVLLNSVPEFIEIKAWLLLTLFLYLHNELISIHFIAIC